MIFTMVNYIEETKKYEISARRDDNSDWYVIDEVSNEDFSKTICIKLENDDILRNVYIDYEECEKSS